MSSDDRAARADAYASFLAGVVGPDHLDELLVAFGADVDYVAQARADVAATSSQVGYIGANGDFVVVDIARGERFPRFLVDSGGWVDLCGTFHPADPATGEGMPEWLLLAPVADGQGVTGDSQDEATR